MAFEKVTVATPKLVSQVQVRQVFATTRNRREASETNHAPAPKK